MLNNKSKYHATISFINEIVKRGTCTGCGLCVGLDKAGKAKMVDTDKGPKPIFEIDSRLPDIIYKSCSGHSINYPELYIKHYNKYPDNWLIGNFEDIYIGFSNDFEIRRNSSSGGILTQVLLYLLDSKKIDAAILVRQGYPSPLKASVFIAKTGEEIRCAAQSIYIPVSVLDILGKLEPGFNYAITCLPEQSAALRVLQTAGNEKARQIKYVLGPYTGTSMYPKAISFFKKMKGIKKNDKIVSLKWRAGEWPGYLEMISESGKRVTSPKVYYNFLIPFFITNYSLQSMDFANEFADLSIGDAWSPKYENQGKGFSVVVSRSKMMNDVLDEMKKKGIISLSHEKKDVASKMHGHMIDFKKRGSYIRNRFRKFIGLKSPDYGYYPLNISLGRIIIEIVISLIFMFGRTIVFRLLLILIPENKLGYLFNSLRLKWKAISKPVKRKGLSSYNVRINNL